jgi:integrase
MEISDAACRGLVLRITAAGVKSWSFRFRDSTMGKPGRVTIGTYPTVSLAGARTRADDMRREVAAGGNPAARKRQDRAAGETRTFGHLANRYLAEHARRKKRSHAADERNLRKHVVPKWRNRDYASIRRADVIELAEGLVAAGKPTLANRVHSLISGIFTFAMDAALLESNPCHRLKKRGVENVGNRTLTDAEIRLFWNGIVESTRARHLGLGLRLALLTGARAGEIAGVNRAELEHLADPDRAAWIIPGARTKNKRDHLIPLVPLARGVVLDLLAMIEAGEPYLFPTRSCKRAGPIRSNSITQAMDSFGGRLKGDDEAERTWRANPPTPHDLRRTVETRLAGLRISKEVRDRILNHIPTDVGTRHYDRHDYADEKREALQRWSCALVGIFQSQSASVVSLAPRSSGVAA